MCIAAHVPTDVLNLRTEANLNVINPMFERSLPIEGDIVEFGCFRGTMSVKFAFYIQALRQNKTVYAFDTFEGFKINDPAGGALGIGAYSDNNNAYEELKKWGQVLPLIPVKGDATLTCSLLRRKLSFVWLDLDMDVLIGPVFDRVRPLIHKDTIVGLDDYGRPETPTVKPWADMMEREGIWKKIEEDGAAFIASYQVDG